MFSVYHGRRLLNSRPPSRVTASMRRLLTVVLWSIVVLNTALSEEKKNDFYLLSFKIFKEIDDVKRIRKYKHVILLLDQFKIDLLC